VALETPRMLRVGSAELVQIDSEEPGNVEVMQAELLGDSVFVPDVEKIEKAIADQLGF